MAHQDRVLGQFLEHQCVEGLALAEASDLVWSFVGELVCGPFAIGELNRALLRSAKSADAVEEACFSGAVLANDGEDLASLHLEVYFREGGHAAEAKSEVGDTE